ncbi:MAG: hypothetical protein GX248_08955 [Peptococcaceae bacterium]|jgi:hypothetical protein|nr:hypothetical protein [Peptococcaceae bacterium]
MSLYSLWTNGTLIGMQPFAYFAPLLSLAVFMLVVFIINALQLVLENKEQHILW